MSRKPYNGWSARERTASGARARRNYASGAWVRPNRCVVCLTVGGRGLIFDHLEDYSTSAEITDRRQAHPHGVVGDLVPERIPLCYRCHMAVHTRFDHIEAFVAYREAVRGGWRFPILRSREWSRFQREHLRGSPTTLRIRSGAVFSRDRQTAWTFLDALMLFPINYKQLLADGDGRPPSAIRMGVLVEEPLVGEDLQVAVEQELTNLSRDTYVDSGLYARREGSQSRWVPVAQRRAASDATAQIEETLDRDAATGRYLWRLLDAGPSAETVQDLLPAEAGA